MKNLSEKSILVNLIISAWSARKYDRKATQEVNDNHNSKDAGRFNKCLIAQDNLTKITNVANRARAYHYENTLMWSDSGERLLPSSKFFEYTAELTKLKSEFDHAVNQFIQDYPMMIEDAKANLNGLFKASDYPNDIGNKFRIKTAFMPIPNTDDLRVNLSSDEIGSLRETIEAEINERFASGQREIYTRIGDQLTHMKKALSDDKAIFRNSLFENVLELVKLLPQLNVANDSNIAETCEELRSLYTDPETVRESKTLRKAKAKEVENMLSKLDAFLKPA